MFRAIKLMVKNKHRGKYSTFFPVTTMSSVPIVSLLLCFAVGVNAQVLCPATGTHMYIIACLNDIFSGRHVSDVPR